MPEIPSRRNTYAVHGEEETSAAVQTQGYASSISQRSPVGNNTAWNSISLPSTHNHSSFQEGRSNNLDPSAFRSSCIDIINNHISSGPIKRTINSGHMGIITNNTTGTVSLINSSHSTIQIGLDKLDGPERSLERRRSSPKVAPPPGAPAEQRGTVARLTQQKETKDAERRVKYIRRLCKAAGVILLVGSRR